jgi:hypothetical protein
MRFGADHVGAPSLKLVDRYAPGLPVEINDGVGSAVQALNNSGSVTPTHRSAYRWGIGDGRLPALPFAA